MDGILTDLKRKPSEQQIARANRVRSLRKMTHLSRADFQKRFGISSATLQHWEDPQKNGLSEKGAKRLNHVLKQIGVYCTVEWLMNGQGPGPQQLQMDASAVPLAVQETQEREIIAEELASFSAHYPEVIHTIIEDDAMEPRFCIGEYVAGVRHYQQSIESLVGKDCIVVTTQGELLVRRIKFIEAPGFYTLTPLNINTNIKRPVIYNAELVSAAPIVWARRVQ